MSCYPHDVIAELAHAFDAYVESEGHTYEVDTQGDEATVTVTAPDGTVSRFALRCRDLD